MDQEFEPADNQTSQGGIPINRVLRLIEEYKGASKIPPDVLEKIGYFRTERGIAPKGAWERRQKKYAEALERKEAETPFQEISVSLSKQEIEGRRLGEAGVKVLEREIESLAIPIDDVEETFPSLVPENNALYNLKEMFETRFSGQSELIEVLFENLSYNLIYSFLEGFYTNCQENFEQSLVSKYYPRQIESAKSNKFFAELEKMKGRYADLAPLQENFRTEMEDPACLEINLREPEYEELNEYCKENNITNLRELSVHFFAFFLEEEGFAALAQDLRASGDFAETLSLLQKRDGVLPDSLYEREKDLKERIKHASKENKKHFSQQLKRIREEKRSYKVLVRGMREYFSLPEFARRFFLRRISKLQNVLVKKGSSEETDFYLVGTYDSVLDRDPGKVSGDCTEGRPLPFDDPNIPVYNIKVFDDERRHIGNLYLLMTRTRYEDEDKPRKVWHFDALQIPVYLDWSASLKSIIDAIAREAKEKEVDLITVNNELHYISNYDYLIDAAINLWRERGEGMVDIEIPNVSDEEEEYYSSFQGTGEARILWER